MDGLQLEIALAEHVTSIRIQNGRWMAILPAMKAGGPYTLQIHEQDAYFLQDPIEFQHIRMQTTNRNFVPQAGSYAPHKMLLH